MDMVSVVRCKDCKHRDGNYCHNKNGFAWFDSFFVRPNDFCSRGEKMPEYEVTVSSIVNNSLIIHTWILKADTPEEAEEDAIYKTKASFKVPVKIGPVTVREVSYEG